MLFSEIMRLAFKSVRSNALRSSLTLMIIAIGIMALVGILTALDCTLYTITSNFNNMGANTLSIERKVENARGRRRGFAQMLGNPISYNEALDFKERFNVPAQVTLSINAASGATAQFGDTKTNPTLNVLGIDENYLAVDGYELAHGRNFSDIETQSGAAKVILGAELANILFDKKPEKAIGADILLSHIRYKVVGVLQSKGSGGGNQGADRVAAVPLEKAREIYDTKGQDFQIRVAILNSMDLETAAAAATGLFRIIRKTPAGREEDFEVRKSDGLLDFLTENTAALRMATVAIGLITLLGAAIGLMNIMLVTVTERTREIGISKALGATRQNILWQFLIEAILICQLGGIIGIILGVLMGNVVSLILKGPFIVPWLWMFLGLVTCLAVGLFSGLYPAMKASKLDPIESLRYE
jgi:putative ABC transport system permease protein